MLQPNGVEAKPIDGAYSIIDTFKMPNRCLFHNYDSMIRTMGHIIQRSYERPLKWYFLTFKPFNSTYEKNIEFYSIGGFDHCRKKVGKVRTLIMTREINAAKIHINMICVSDRPLSDLLHEKKTNRYFIYCQECTDRQDTFKYIIKESKQRYFYKFKDYVYQD